MLCISILNHAHCCKLVFLDDEIIAIFLKRFSKPQSLNIGYDNHNENLAMLAIKDWNNVNRFENWFLQHKPIYPCIYDALYDDAMYDAT